VFTSMLQPSGDLFDDISQLQERLDQVFGGRAQGSSIRAVSRAGAFPALNVGTWADALEIYAFAPGIDAKSVQLSVEKGLLSISGERGANDPEAAGVQVYARERFRGPFRRVVELPDDADPSRAQATYKNGVLKVVIPKDESSKPRQIPVGGAA
jgi:HSP20 family protein